MPADAKLGVTYGTPAQIETSIAMVSGFLCRV